MFSSDLVACLEALGRECIEKFADAVSLAELRHSLADRYYPSAKTIASKNPSFEPTLRSLPTFEAAIQLMNSRAVFGSLLEALPWPLVSAPPALGESVFNARSLTELVIASGHPGTTRPSAVLDGFLTKSWLETKIGKHDVTDIVEQGVLSFVAAVLRPGIDNRVEHIRRLVSGYEKSLRSGYVTCECFCLLEQFQFSRQRTKGALFKPRGWANQMEASEKEWKLDDDVSLRVLPHGSVEYFRMIPEFERFIPQTHGRFLEMPLLQVMAQCQQEYSIHECFYGLGSVPTALLSLRSILRLYGKPSEGDPRFTAVFGVLSMPVPLLETHHVIPEGPLAFTYPPIYELPEKEWDEFKFIWKVILNLYQSDQDSQFILKALRWFESGRECLRYEDKIMHHFIGLESLFGRKDDNPSRMFLERVSYFLNSSQRHQRRTKLDNELGKAYGIRNDVVHGDRIANIDDKLRLAATCDVVDYALRTSLLTLIALRDPRLESSKAFVSKDQFVSALADGINGDEKALRIWRSIWSE
jgi:hypothetical protein